MFDTASDSISGVRRWLRRALPVTLHRSLWVCGAEEYPSREAAELRMKFHQPPRWTNEQAVGSRRSDALVGGELG